MFRQAGALLLFFLGSGWSLSLYSQPGGNPFPMPVQFYIAQMDRATLRPDGEWRGILSRLEEGEKERSLRTVQLYRQGGDSLYEIYRFSGGLEWRILYRKGGEDVWFFDALRSEVHHFSLEEARRRTLPGTSFTFGHLSPASFEATFDILSGETKQGSDSLPYLHVSLRSLPPFVGNPPASPLAGEGEERRESPGAPAFSPLRALSPLPDPLPRKGSGHEELLLDPKRGFAPLRMDSYDGDDILFRVLHFFYATPGNGSVEAFPLKGAEGSSLREESLYRRMEALDLRSGTISRLEFFEYRNKTKLPEKLFAPRFLER